MVGWLGEFVLGFGNMEELVVVGLEESDVKGILDVYDLKLGYFGGKRFNGIFDLNCDLVEMK